VPTIGDGQGYAVSWLALNEVRKIMADNGIAIKLRSGVTFGIPAA